MTLAIHIIGWVIVYVIFTGAFMWANKSYNTSWKEAFGSAIFCQGVLCLFIAFIAVIVKLVIW